MSAFPRTRSAPVALVVAAVLALLSGCGGGNDGSAQGTTSGSAEGRPLTATEADFTIELDKSDLAAGTYTITVNNEGDATHDLVVEKDGNDVAKSDTVGPGDSTTLTVDLEPGDYVFYCSIGDHRQMGMETPVTVS